MIRPRVGGIVSNARFLLGVQRSKLSNASAAGRGVSVKGHAEQDLKGGVDKSFRMGRYGEGRGAG